MLFHKLYQVTASTIHNVICAQQTKNVRRAIADLCVSSQSPRHNMGVEGGGGKFWRQETTKNGNSNSCKKSFPVDSFFFLYFRSQC